MKKFFVFLLFLIILLVGAFVGANWWIGTQIPDHAQNVNNRLQTMLNQQLKRLPIPMPIKPTLQVTTNTSIFNSVVIYSVNIAGQAAPLLMLELEHGPLPLSRLMKMDFQPAILIGTISMPTSNLTAGKLQTSGSLEVDLERQLKMNMQINPKIDDNGLEISPIKLAVSGHAQDIQSLASTFSVTSMSNKKSALQMKGFSITLAKNRLDMAWDSLETPDNHMEKLALNINTNQIAVSAKKIADRFHTFEKTKFKLQGVDGMAWFEASMAAKEPAPFSTLFAKPAKANKKVTFDFSGSLQDTNNKFSGDMTFQSSFVPNVDIDDAQFLQELMQNQFGKALQRLTQDGSLEVTLANLQQPLDPEIALTFVAGEKNTHVMKLAYQNGKLNLNDQEIPVEQFPPQIPKKTEPKTAPAATNAATGTADVPTDMPADLPTDLTIELPVATEAEPEVEIQTEELMPSSLAEEDLELLNLKPASKTKTTQQTTQQDKKAKKTQKLDCSLAKNIETDECILQIK